MRLSIRRAAHGYSIPVLLHQAGASPADRLSVPPRKRARSQVMLHFSFDALSHRPSLELCSTSMRRPADPTSDGEMIRRGREALWVDRIFLLMLKRRDLTSEPLKNLRNDAQV